MVCSLQTRFVQLNADINCVGFQNYIKNIFICILVAPVIMQCIGIGCHIPFSQFYNVVRLVINHKMIIELMWL
jgi:hypothetical protein